LFGEETYTKKLAQGSMSDILVQVSLYNFLECVSRA